MKEIYIKLIDGAQIVGKLVDTDENLIHIDDALELKFRYSETGDPYIFFSKSAIYVEEYTMSIPWHHVLHTSTNLIEQFSRFYQTSLSQIKMTFPMSINNILSKSLTTMSEDKTEDFYTKDDGVVH
jgi:hypothetical protein